jgi:hypothetical protein
MLGISGLETKSAAAGQCNWLEDRTLSCVTTEPPLPPRLAGNIIIRFDRDRQEYSLGGKLTIEGNGSATWVRLEESSEGGRRLQPVRCEDLRKYKLLPFDP